MIAVELQGHGHTADTDRAMTIEALAGADGRVKWHLLATDWNLVRLRLLGQVPDLPTTPARRAVQAELAQQRGQSQHR